MNCTGCKYKPYRYTVVRTIIVVVVVVVVVVVSFFEAEGATILNRLRAASIASVMNGRLFRLDLK